MLRLKLVQILIDKRTGGWVLALNALDPNREADFLCRRGEDVWVSEISLAPNPDVTLPKNCKDGCLYVQPKGKGPVIPVDCLDELYFITQEEDD